MDFAVGSENAFEGEGCWVFEVSGKVWAVVIDSPSLLEMYWNGLCAVVVAELESALAVVPDFAAGSEKAFESQVCCAFAATGKAWAVVPVKSAPPKIN